MEAKVERHRIQPVAKGRALVCRECGKSITLVRPARGRRGHWAHVGNPDRWYFSLLNQRRRNGYTER